MGKVLLYASIAVTAATTALGLINKSKISEVKDQLGTAQQEVQQKTASLEQSQKSLKEAKDTLTTAVAEKEQVTEQLETVKNEAEQSKSQISDLTAQVSAKETKISELTAQLEEEKQKIDSLASGQSASPTSAPSAEDQAKMQEQETLIAKLQGDLDSSRTQLEELRRDKANRAAGLMRKGLEGRVLAVNQAWNFVVLNLGDRNGVVGNAEMLVKRGNQLVGKVRVTSVEPSTSIADIVSSSVPRGISIQPGDNVIYQATAE